MLNCFSSRRPVIINTIVDSNQPACRSEDGPSRRPVVACVYVNSIKRVQFLTCFQRVPVPRGAGARFRKNERGRAPTSSVKFFFSRLVRWIKGFSLCTLSLLFPRAIVFDCRKNKKESEKERERE